MLLLLPLLSGAQQTYRYIATKEAHERLLRENPQMQERRRAIEQQSADFQKNGSPQLVTIPVIFHIIYHAEKERLSEEQALSQLEALNRDFRMKEFRIQHPADTLEGFAQRAADTEIEFCLAAGKDAKGNKTALHYVHSEVPIWKSDDAIKFSKTGGADALAPEHYLNVWVCRMDETVSGYAQMPGGPEETDGIVLDYRFFGTMGTATRPYDEGKTLTHLVGNYLNLFDLWGSGALCADDYVEDTPLHNSPNYGCPGYRHISTCSNNPVEMTMNFMDNTDDACMYMFTEGQKIRMQAMFGKKGQRSKLVANGSLCNQAVTERSGELPDDEGLPDSSIEHLAVTVFPNPATRQLYLLITSPKEGTARVTVHHSIGSVIYETSIALTTDSFQQTLDCNQWAEGAYFVKVQTSGEMVSRLFIIQN